jgi:hypothetical protein
LSIATDLVPQADDMDKVIKTVDAISQGHRTFEEIAQYIGLVGRQGRYYRKASEILGFTKRSGANASVITKLGEEFINASTREQFVILQESLLRNPVFIEVINRLKEAGSDGLTDVDIKDTINSITQMTAGMVYRRMASVKSWLKYTKIAKESGSKIYLANNPPGSILIESVGDPLAQILKPKMKLKTFKPADNSETERKKGLRSIEYTFDEAKREKAERSHRMLVYLMAEKVAKAGGVPTESSHSIDLATEIDGVEFIFEMKSITGKSLHGQIRRGIAQLYEYGYLHNMPSAKLCLVLEKQPKGRKTWLISYLVNDRGIMLFWKSNSGFDCPDECKPVIGQFL